MTTKPIHQRILVLNGPNLNLLGQREPEIYGAETLTQLEASLRHQASALDITLDCRQSNAEHELVNWIQEAAKSKVDFILLNAAALTHTSVALRDALSGVKIPFIEVHISNVYAREPFRHHSYLSDIAVGVICGLGTAGYGFALQAAHDYLTKQQRAEN
ncbi:type II 3-dehydroquinate dehydratase [Pseudidiomarina taiwanensis]|uniref:3-dehydroquinate dehydratase n=1 Tax=Pseudidiomarina taiwanensis TaxID=337250 RepID=A0A432ZFV7_9GAMM|nr:type II 3-dehydroquinate dehydratase [Pseudidiomarina taiwanensis]RUO76848.1 type II 3-dehydroquinate dehydratase [Pseudidiomarina taiwanensis]